MFVCMCQRLMMVSDVIAIDEIRHTHSVNSFIYIINFSNVIH